MTLILFMIFVTVENKSITDYVREHFHRTTNLKYTKHSNLTFILHFTCVLLRQLANVSQFSFFITKKKTNNSLDLSQLQFLNALVRFGTSVLSGLFRNSLETLNVAECVVLLTAISALLVKSFSGQLCLLFDMSVLHPQYGGLIKYQ